MDKSNILTSLKKLKVVAVVRAKSVDEAEQTSSACIKGGVKAIEIAFTTPHANEVISDLTRQYNGNTSVIIGAGTVLDEITARIAIISGAKFIVSATFSKKVALICNLYGVPYIPGCFTPTEVQNALSMGAQIIKIFPSSAANITIVNELQGPFPQSDFMITGGVNIKNVNEWFSHGASLVGIGGQLVGPGANGNFDKVTENAQKFMQLVEKVS